MNPVNDTPVIQATSLQVGYGGKQVLFDVSLTLRSREVLCLIGHNGAGKSTLMRTLFGLIKPMAGQLQVDGQVLGQHTPRALADLGIAMMPEGRGIFPSLSVQDIWSATLLRASRAAF